MMQTRGACTNTGKPVLDVLRAKNPDVPAPLASSPDAYPRKPTDLIPVNLTEVTVIEVARRLSGCAGPKALTLSACNI